MAERNQEAYPFAPYANGQAMARSDAESATVRSQKQKRNKCLIYVAIFIIFQIIVITVAALTIMRIKSPKYRIRSVTVENLTTTPNATNPSLNFKFIAEVTVKNPNFGRYKYDQTTISFVYMGTQVGDAVIPKATAKTRATKKINVTGVVSTTNSNLESDLSSGNVMLSTTSTLKGKVYLLNMIKKNKSAKMNCTMILNVNENVVRDIMCK